MTTATARFPIGGSRQSVYDYMRSLVFVMSDWSDKAWTRADGIEVRVFGAGSMVQVGNDEMPLGELERFLWSRL